jgi:hypothetical protein
MWNSKTEDRLRAWKQFRIQISEKSFFDALAETVKLWSFAPIVNRHSDFTSLGEFPDPWILLLQDGHTDISKALGMLYTLYMSKHGTEHHYRLQIVEASTGLERYYLVVIDSGKYILNYNFNEIINIEQLGNEIKVLYDFSTDDLQLTKL